MLPTKELTGKVYWVFRWQWIWVWVCRSRYWIKLGKPQILFSAFSSCSYTFSFSNSGYVVVCDLRQLIYQICAGALAESLVIAVLLIYSDFLHGSLSLSLSCLLTYDASDSALLCCTETRSNVRQRCCIGLLCVIKWRDERNRNRSG